MHNGIINDNTTSIRLIDDECNIYTVPNAKKVKRINENTTYFRMWYAKDVLCKDKALLCWRTKKSPYTVPSDKPIRIENII